MKFYSIENHPNQLVWDSVKNKSLCEFKNGVVETDDQNVCETLIGLGYKYDEQVELIDIKESEIDEEFESLKLKAKELKIRGWHVKSKEKLIEAIAEVEKVV